MSIVEIKENIVNLLETIIKRSEIIERQNGNRNLLEIDLAMEDIRLLYREMDRLRKITEADQSVGTYNVSERKIFSPTVTKQSVESPPQIQEKPEEKQNHPPHPIDRPSDQDRDNSFARETSEIEEKPVPTPKPQQAEKQERDEKQQSPPAEVKPQPMRVEQEVKAVPKASPPAATNPPKPKENNVPAPKAGDDKKNQLVGERYKTEKNSLHERLAQIKDDKSIGARMQYKPVSSIKDAIGLNEKFLFINELFGGDINGYNDSVANLNNCSSIHDAFELLNDLTEQYQWDGKRSAETIEKFANVVQRRYME